MKTNKKLIDELQEFNFKNTQNIHLFFLCALESPTEKMKFGGNDMGINPPNTKKTGTPFI